MVIEELEKLCDQIDEVIEIYESTAKIRVKFVLIFGLDLQDKIVSLGFPFEWSDPDAGYEEDLASFIGYLKAFRSDLGDLVPPRETEKKGA